MKAKKVRYRQGANAGRPYLDESVGRSYQDEDLDKNVICQPPPKQKKRRANE